MNSTIISITVRGLLGRRRALLLLALPLLIIGLTVLAKALEPDPTHWAGAVVVGLGFAVVLPVLALVVGTAVLGSEIDDGTIVHVLAKPLPRREIVLAKLLVAVVTTAVVTAVPMFVAGVVIDSLRLGLALALACLVGSLAYCSLFVALSLVTRRPVLLGLVYVLFWEGLLGNILSGTRVLSIEQYVISIAAYTSSSPLLHGRVAFPLALALSGVVLVAGVFLATARLRDFSLTGETS